MSAGARTLTDSDFAYDVVVASGNVVLRRSMLAENIVQHAQEFIGSDRARNNIPEIWLVDVDTVDLNNLAEMSGAKHLVLLTNSQDVFLSQWFRRFPRTVQVMPALSPIPDFLLQSLNSRRVKPVGSSCFDSTERLGSMTVGAYADVVRVLESIRNSLKMLNVFPDLIGIVEMAAWELVMNAMIDAPIDRSSGKTLFVDVKERQTIVMRSGDEVAISWGRTGEYFGVTVTDRFGRLTKDAVISKLERCHEANFKVNLDGCGAGVGLYRTFLTSSGMFFELQPAEATSVTAMFAITRRQRDFELLPKSMGFFESDRG